MNMTRELEGEEKYPVLAKILIDKLLKSGKFSTEKEITAWIKKLQNESTIYESKPGYFNIV